MLRVVYALGPGIAAYVWFFGWGVLVNIVLAATSALAAEAVILLMRGKPLAPALSDGSALVTGLLLALCLPPLTPWWIPVLGSAFSIVFGKQIFGGLGFNPFNPAMLGYAMLLISFPREMTSWVLPHTLFEQPLSSTEMLLLVFAERLPEHIQLDAMTSATVLDTMKTELARGFNVEEIRVAPVFGLFGGRGWEWVGLGYAVGGLWLIYKRVITWHIPIAVLGGLAIVALSAYIFDPDNNPSPLFHLASGAALLGAFFIATDPVSASTTNRGRLIYGVGIGVLTFVIRTWGGYPDGIAFAVLIMNMATPTIDSYTQPRVFGHHRE